MFNSLEPHNGVAANCLTTDCSLGNIEREAAAGALVLDNCVEARVSVLVLDKAPGDRNEVPGVRVLIASPGWDLLSN